MKLISGVVLILWIITLSFTFNACNTDEPAVKPGSLAFHVHTLVDSTEIENYGEVITRKDGRQMTVNTAQLYISNVKLIKIDGSVIDGPSSPVLVKQGVEEYELGEAPAGNYKIIRFDVGLSDVTNSSNPSSTDLNLNQPSMWFGATAQPNGYSFINFQGTIDTSSAPYGGPLVPFAYKIGTNAHRVTITMPEQNFTISAGQLSVVHLEANYGKLLDGIQLNQSSNIHIVTVEENGWSWVSDMENRIAQMFYYQE